MTTDLIDAPLISLSGVPAFPFACLVGNNMASLSGRELDDDTTGELRARAAQRGVSMEKEARRIIRLAISSPDKLDDLAVELFNSGLWGRRASGVSE